jgi:hypothetical protein
MLYVVVYNHQYGVDVTALARTEELANREAEKIVQDWRDDFNIDPELSDAEARKDWMELTGGRESIEVLVAPEITEE